MPKNTQKIWKQAMVPLLALAMMGTTGCQPLIQLLTALAGSGTNPAGATTPSALTGSNPTGTNPAAPTSLLGTQANPAAPGASLPAPAASAQQVQQLATKFGIKITGSCAKDRALQNLEAGLTTFAAPQNFKDVTYDIPCESQDPGGSAGEWTGEETQGPYKIIFSGPPFQELERAIFIHETGHHLHLAHTNTAIRQELEANTKETPEYYPSAYSKPGADGRPTGAQTETMPDGRQVVIDLDKGEQIAELIAYCKEMANGGVLTPQPGDTPNWQCPGTLAPVMQKL